MPEHHVIPDPVDEPPPRGANGLNWWADVIAAALLGLSAVAAGWAAYQSSLWNSEAIFALNEANAAERTAMALQTASLQTRAVDVNVFLEYVRALSMGDDRFATIVYKRLPPDLKTAIDAWLATQPFTNPNAPKTPFVMKEYRLSSEQESERLMRTYFDRLARARAANRIADRYVLLTIPFAIVSLVSGLSTRFRTRSTRSGLVALAFGIFVFGVVELVSEAVLNVR